jgi:hypothetical protein
MDKQKKGGLAPGLGSWLGMSCKVNNLTVLHCKEIRWCFGFGRDKAGYTTSRRRRCPLVNMLRTKHLNIHHGFIHPQRRDMCSPVSRRCIRRGLQF